MMMSLELATYVKFYFVEVVIEGVKDVAIQFVIPIDVQRTVVMGPIVMSAMKTNMRQNPFQQIQKSISNVGVVVANPPITK
tara:strand:+ start:23 stop:265 length:243 start_codon:yes stop_codon:yes gene_type:complete